LQLKTQTDYAIRILLYLSSHGGFSVKNEMSKALGIAGSYLPKITYRLRSAGWISSSSGITGGYLLLRNPENISLLDVMYLMEDTVKMNRCLEPDDYCSRHATKTCPVHQIYKTFQDFSDQYFSHVTISDLLEQKSINEFYSQILNEVSEKISEYNGCAKSR
jgi:putative two-component system response regulator